jgi:hypothetical protein
MVWYNFCENIHKFHNSLKKNTTNSLSLSHQDSYNFLTMWPKKMKHIKSPEKKISTKVLFMTLYHTATDNSQSNQHQLSKIRKIWQCYKYILTPNKLVLNLRVIIQLSHGDAIITNEMLLYCVRGQTRLHKCQHMCRNIMKII